MVKKGGIKQVIKHPDGWAVKNSGAARAGRVFSNKREAEQWAKKVVGKHGGEVHVYGRDGHILKRDRYGSDPKPSKNDSRTKNRKDVTKIRTIGSSQGVLLTREILESSGLKEGDSVYVLSTPDGVKLTPYDPEFAKVVEFGRDFMRRYRDDMRELAK